MVPDDSAGPVDVTESVPLTAEALEKLFWQQFQTTATQTSRSQTPENTCLDGETQTEITYDVTSLGPASLIDPLTIGDTDSAVSTTTSVMPLGGWAESALAHPEFGSSVNPIPTKGDRLCPPHY